MSESMIYSLSEYASKYQTFDFCIEKYKTISG